MRNSGEQAPVAFSRVDHIPLFWIAPDKPRPATRLAIWLPGGLGKEDDHVPPDGALRFQKALRETYQSQPDRLRVNLHPGVGHQMIPAMWQNCLAWFLSH